ncbi:arabinosidase [Ilyomonas limi]|uniref:Arabinosidase n=1 Tax=Ilyomonas limi TaxID=2575867 RepID=A0A4U3L0Q9_9BACT|nr:glycoside hydrolase family 43 protein [Ilyomonas limi]TKK67027.1 arabinosidase [Ilyomonas limi]
MKNTNYFNVFVCCIVMLLCACTSSKKAWLYTSFNEPAKEGLRLMYSYDGKHWTYFNHIFLKPLVGKEKIMRDPSMIKDKNGIYHLVWTTEWKGNNGFGYASSADLIHWSKEQYMPVMKEEPTVVNVWAPEWFYNEEVNNYMIIWASTIPYRFDKGIEDEFNNHRLYYISTTDFKNFTKPKLFFDPGFSSIDATLVKRGDKDYVLVFKDNTRNERSIKVAFGKTPIGPFANVSSALTGAYTEGPTVAHVKEEWFIYFDAYRNKDFEAIKTKDFKTFTDATKEISIPEGHKHGTILPVTKKDIKKMQKALSNIDSTQMK